MHGLVNLILADPLHPLESGLLSSMICFPLTVACLNAGTPNQALSILGISNEEEMSKRPSRSRRL
ncbi:MAG: hypothetical protein HC767_09475 [Akkermansiaceae bacterium]|nr:hypothetical protein [Akkermansiaceae bacterium]